MDKLLKLNFLIKTRLLPTCTSTDRTDVFMSNTNLNKRLYRLNVSESFSSRVVCCPVIFQHVARSSLFSQQLQTFGSFLMGLLLFLQLWLFVKRLAVSAMFVLKDNEWSSLASNTLCRLKHFADPFSCCSALASSVSFCSFNLLMLFSTIQYF